VREHAQELVADDVAEHILDLLETNEVDAEKGEARAGLRRLRERHLQVLREGRAVRQAGQGVVTRHVHDLRLGLPPLGDVLEHAQHVARLAVLARDGEPLARDHARAMVRRGDRNILREQLLAGRQHPVVTRGDEVGVFLAEYLVAGLADHLIAPQPEEFLAGTIDELVALVAGVLDDQRRRHVLDDGVEECLGAMQLTLGP
jgi:hypothetical protein